MAARNERSAGSHLAACMCSTPALYLSSASVSSASAESIGCPQQIQQLAVERIVGDEDVAVVQHLVAAVEIGGDGACLRSHSGRRGARPGTVRVLPCP